MLYLKRLLDKPTIKFMTECPDKVLDYRLLSCSQLTQLSILYLQFPSPAHIQRGYTLSLMVSKEIISYL